MMVRRRNKKSIWEFQEIRTKEVVRENGMKAGNMKERKKGKKPINNRR